MLLSMRVMHRQPLVQVCMMGCLLRIDEKDSQVLVGELSSATWLMLILSLNTFVSIIRQKGARQVNIFRLFPLFMKYDGNAQNFYTF